MPIPQYGQVNPRSNPTYEQLGEIIRVLLGGIAVAIILRDVFTTFLESIIRDLWDEIGMAVLDICRPCRDKIRILQDLGNYRVVERRILSCSIAAIT